MNIDKEIEDKVMGGVWDGGEYLMRYWNPSTNIKQAFEVIEKMRERGFAISLYQFLDDPKDHNWCCEINEIGTGNGCSAVVADTPAMAICLAALKVVE